MSATGRPTFRFAPSPNGALHLGHALSALTGFEMAQRLGGRFLLRIEDIDPARTREAHVTAILDDLAWLGIRWEEPVLRQSEHLADYRAAARRLTAMGLLYPCFASRQEIAAHHTEQGGGLDPEGAPIYPGLHRDLPRDVRVERLARGDPHVMRLDMARAVRMAVENSGAPLSFAAFDENFAVSTVHVDPMRWGDVVIQRKDVATSYHLSVVVDDARQGITHVTRGMDLLAATDVHRLLQVLLDLPTPLYHHHRLIMDASGRKLAKSARDTSLAALRAQGMTARDMRRLVAP